MRELSEKEIEQLYKEAKMTEIPDLWKNIEGNLAPKNPAVVPEKENTRKTRKKTVSFRWISGMAAVLVVAVLAIPAWRLLRGGSKSYDGASSAMENTGSANEMENMNGAADLMAPAESDWEMMPEDQNAADEEQILKGEEENEFHLKVELQVEQVQTTLEGYLVTGEILSAEENWFETGERVTLFYEGDDYREEDFSGTLYVLLDVEEENLKILEILP